MTATHLLDTGWIIRHLRGAAACTLDLLIGATALNHDLTLLTPNRRHFARIPGLRIIANP